MTREEFLKAFPNLVKNYRPSVDAIAKISNVSLLMVVGPSGVGKTSLINLLGLHYVSADTTRAKRPEEREGVDYHFRNDYDNIIEQINASDFVQVAVDSGGDLKATRGVAYPESGTAVMAVVAGVIPNFRGLGFKETKSVFVTPPSYEEWMHRLNAHDLDPEQQTRRLAEAARSLEFALNDKETRFILNDDLEKAAEQVKSVLAGLKDEQREAQARKTAESLLESVGYNKDL